VAGFKSVSVRATDTDKNAPDRMDGMVEVKTVRFTCLKCKKGYDDDIIQRCTIDEFVGFLRAKKCKFCGSKKLAFSPPEKVKT